LRVTSYAPCIAATLGIAAAGFVADTLASASTDEGNHLYLFNAISEPSVTSANNLFESVVY
jgi:hypothetical protein